MIYVHKSLESSARPDAKKILLAPHCKQLQAYGLDWDSRHNALFSLVELWLKKPLLPAFY